MAKDKKAFGNFLREMIKQTGISQSAFYSAVEITKPYFYDILSGKVNPPPPDVQYKMLENLNLDEQQRNEFLNLAAEGRGEVPADIAKLIADHPAKLAIIRETLISLLAAQGYGNITPCDRDIVKGGTYSHLLHLVTRNEDDLMQTLTQEQQEIFEKFKDCASELNDANELTAFTIGFKIGMRLALEAMISTSDITDPKMN